MLFHFSGSDANGTGTATMLIDVDGNTMTVVLDNTSPYTKNEGDGPNTPGITGFGFNLENDPLPTITDWGLTALLHDGSGPELIGSPENEIGADGIADTTDDEWVMETFFAGVTLDFLPQTDGANIDGALYNPEHIGSPSLPGGVNDVFFTTATLTLTFSEPPILDFEDDFSPFVRMQRVGTGGSLKLPGEPGDPGDPDDPDDPPPGDPIPEPGSLALLGAGLVALRSARRKKSQ